MNEAADAMFPFIQAIQQTAGAQILAERALPAHGLWVEVKGADVVAVLNRAPPARDRSAGAATRDAMRAFLAAHVVADRIYMLDLETIAWLFSVQMP